MKFSPLASLAGLARAFDTLRPDDDRTRREIATLLGIAAAAEEVQVAQFLTPHLAAQIGNEERGEDAAAPQTPPPVSQGGGETIPPLPAAELAMELTPDDTVAPRIPSWFQVQPLSRPAAEPVPPPGPDPLFEPRWTRAILIGALSTSGAGALDLETLTHKVAQRRPILGLPRKATPTLACGVQVLVDRGDRMLPFTTDLTQLTEQIRIVAGREAVEVFAFDGFPGRGAGPRSRRTWRPYPASGAPRSGAAVAVISDLGLGTPSVGSRGIGPADWISLARRLDRTGNPVVAFVPYGPDHWPPELRRTLTLVHWDHRTTAGDVRRSLALACRARESPR
ncbi:MAG TPA: hypothetical protein DD490_20210 [Acidobacteria bacterium]|nr:hypothetical protein [Acidobacteriota bacterium]